MQLQANGNVTTPLTISTQVLPVAELHAPGWKGSTGVLSGTLAAMLLMPWGFARRRRLTSLLLIVFAATMAFSITGCTNIGYAIHAVHPGTYVVPVTAVDSTGKSKTASFTLIITS